MSENLVLGTHVVGFLPSKAKEGNQKIATNDTDAGFGSTITVPGYPFPLHQISNIYLSKGYRVVYGAESAPGKTVKARLFRNIEDADASRQPQESISIELLTVVDRDLIYERCGKNHNSIVEFWNSSVKSASQSTQILSKGQPDTADC